MSSDGSPPPPSYDESVAATAAATAHAAVAAAIAAVGDGDDSAGGKTEEPGSGGSIHSVVKLTRACKELHSTIKLVVWDFDLTLLRIHSFGCGVKEDHVRSGRRSIERDFVDLPMFQELVKYLRDTASISVAIASFGEYSVISAYTDLAFPKPSPVTGAPYFTKANTSTPSVLGGGMRDGCSVPGGKLPQLSLLLKAFKVKPDEVLFFDDDANNIALAQREGYMAYHVNPKEGFHQQLWAQALADLTAVDKA